MSLGSFLAVTPLVAHGQTGPGTTITLVSPFDCSDITSCFAKIMDVVVKVVTPVAVIMIMYGAFLVMTSRDNATQRKSGLHAIWWAILGFAIILLASGIAAVLTDIVNGK